MTGLFLATVWAARQASTSMAKASGYVTLAFCALGAYIFFGSASKATGGKDVPLGS